MRSSGVEVQVGGRVLLFAICFKSSINLVCERYFLGGRGSDFFTFLNVSRYGHGYGSRVLTMVCQE